VVAFVPGAAWGAPVPLAAPPARLDVGAPVSAVAAALTGGVAGIPGGLRAIGVDLGGGMRLAGTVALGEGVQPSAIAERPVDDRIDLLVADRAADRLFDVRGDARHGFSITRTVSIGHEPVAMTLGEFDADMFDDVAVADASDDTVTVLPGAAHGGFGAARVFAVGAAPVDVVADRLDGDNYVDLAVADHDASALTVLYGDGKDGILRRSDIPLPGHPVAIANLVNDNSFDFPDLSRDDRADLAVTYDDSAKITVLLGGKRGPRQTATLALPAAGRPTAIATGTFNAHGRVDAAVAQADPGTVTLLLNDGRGHLVPQPPIPMVGQPAALAVTDGAGDDRQDLLIADATGAVEDLVPGDRFLLATGNTVAEAVQASDGLIYYAQKIGSAWRELRVSSAQAPTAPAPRRLAIPPAFFPISVYLGEDSSGRAELSYARCHARRRCRPYAFPLPNGPERPIRIRRPVGCQVDTFARWRAMAVYELSSERRASCPAHARGLWVKASRGAPRLLTTRLETLDFIHDRQVAWTEFRRRPGGNFTFRVRMSSLAGPAITVDHSDAAGCDLGFHFGGPVYDHGYLYWTQECSSSLAGDFQHFKRARIRTPRCRSVISDFVASQEPDFAVDNGEVFYSIGTSLLQVTPKLRWPTARCAAR
jgi:hypothetical protein